MSAPLDNAFLKDFNKLAGALPGNATPWLAPVRQSAYAQLCSEGFPGTRDENWKYTDTRKLLKQLDDGALRPGPLAESTETAFEGVQRFELDCHRMVFINGRFQANLSDTVEVDGIDVMNIGAALDADADALEAMLAGSAEYSRAGIANNSFAAMNTALLDDGAFIKLAPNAELKKPLHLIFMSVAQTNGEQAGVVANPRVVIAAGDNSRATIVESHLALEGAANFTNIVNDIAVAPGARVEHIKMLEGSDADQHISNTHARVHKDGEYVNHNIAIGGSFVRNDLHVALLEPGASTRLNGLFAMRGTQHIDNHLHVEHIAPRTFSDQFYRGVADDRGRGVFNGKVEVHKDAQKIEANQASNNLLLAKLAEIDTKPELEIYADDVKCSHGATIGQLDNNMLFYLQSRGIDAETARALLIYAFMDAVVARLPFPAIRAHLESQIVGRLPDADLVREFVSA